MASEPQVAPNRLRNLLRRVALWFVAGVLIILPVAITVAVISWIASLVHRLVGPDTPVGDFLTRFGLRFVSDHTGAYVVGVIVVLTAIFVIGVVAEAGAQRFMQRLLDGLLQRIPIVGSIYGTSRQVVTMFDRKDEAAVKRMQVVFCCFGKEGGAGFLALLISPERYRINSRDYQIIIVPTAPVPFGGGLLFVPAEVVQPTDVSVDAMISIYVSMGITADQFLKRASHESPDTKKQ
jgi:uncharacterized membrane protein